MYTEKDYDEANSIIHELKELNGAIKYDSDYCAQVLIPLGDSLMVRVSGAGEECDAPLRASIVRRNPNSVWGVDFMSNLRAL